MKKTDPQQGALVPYAQSLPATIPVELSREEISDEKEKLKRSLAHREGMRGAVPFMRSGAVAFGGVTSIGMPFALAGDPFSVVIVGLTGTLTAAMATMGVFLQKEHYSAINNSYERSEEHLRDKFKQKQRDVIQEKKQQIILKAEEHIGCGDLLGLEDLQWVAMLDPDSLEKASDELAITVLQTRQMIAHMRAAKEGNRAAKPSTFASLGIDPSMAPNRTYLREKLINADKGMPEDTVPEVSVQFAPRKKLKASFAKAVFQFIVPLTSWELYRSGSKVQLPQAMPVTMKMLSPPDDTAQLLSAYEAANAPLDLPAMRGWKRSSRKLLPSPGGAR